MGTVSLFWQSTFTYKKHHAQIMHRLSKNAISGEQEQSLFVDVVIAVTWARILHSLALRDPHFRLRITLGVVRIRSMVCAECVPGCLRSGFGVALIKRVQKKLIKLGERA